MNILFCSGDHERSERDQRRRQDSSSLVYVLHGKGKNNQKHNQFGFLMDKLNRCLEAQNHNQ